MIVCKIVVGVAFESIVPLESNNLEDARKEIEAQSLEELKVEMHNTMQAALNPMGGKVTNVEVELVLGEI